MFLGKLSEFEPMINHSLMTHADVPITISRLDLMLGDMINPEIITKDLLNLVDKLTEFIMLLRNVIMIP